MIKSWFKPSLLDYIWFLFTGDFLCGGAKQYFASLKKQNDDTDVPSFSELDYHEGDEFK